MSHAFKLSRLVVTCQIAEPRHSFDGIAVVRKDESLPPEQFMAVVNAIEKALRETNAHCAVSGFSISLSTLEDGS